jgi:hypothetical protein
LEVRVLDANDNEPKFENGTYEVFVTENTPISTTIARVKASDPDEGPNGKVVYKFKPQTLHEHGDLFAIEENTGAIYVKGHLDYEVGILYVLDVIAQDEGPDSHPSQTTVVVRIQDTNDNAPDIKVNTLTATGEAEVPENARVGTFVAHVSVDDLDTKDNGKVTCTIDSDYFTLQKMYLTEYKVTTARVFDFEQRLRYHIRLTCMDHGWQTQTSTVHIKVNIIDENDHAPRFRQNFYTVSMDENNFIGTIILQVNATDKDMGLAGKIEYKLDIDAKDLLEIDAKTGMIKIKALFDYEEIPRLDFHVIATDKGRPPMEDKDPVELIIVDLNDELPEFTLEEYAFGVFENEPTGTEVGKVVAVDSDSAPFNKFSYLMEPVEGTTNLFNLDPQSGSTKQELDRETLSLYLFKVIAIPLDDPSYSSTASVKIYVADKNDHAPILELPNAENHTVLVSNKATAGHVFTRLRAKDIDSGASSRLSFSITSGNYGNAFTVDPVTGAISVNAVLSQYKHRQFNLRVLVRDSGDPPKHNSGSLTVVVDQNIDFVPPKKGSSSGVLGDDNLTVILGIVLATVFVAIVIIIAIVILLRRKHRTNHGNKSPTKEEQVALNVAGTPQGHGSTLQRDHNQARSPQPLQTSQNNKLHSNPVSVSRDDMMNMENESRNQPCHEHVIDGYTQVIFPN